jgi:hypothetical protein
MGLQVQKPRNLTKNGRNGNVQSIATIVDVGGFDRAFGLGIDYLVKKAVGSNLITIVAMHTIIAPSALLDNSKISTQPWRLDGQSHVSQISMNQLERQMTDGPEYLWLQGTLVDLGAASSFTVRGRKG